MKIRSISCLLAVTVLCASLSVAFAQSIRIVDKSGKAIPTSKAEIKKSIEDKKKEAAKEREERKDAFKKKIEKAKEEGEQKQIDAANKRLNKIGLQLKK